MGIISLALQVSMLPIAISGPEPTVFVKDPGSGVVCVPGDVVTIDYSIEDETGKELANSERRGLPSTVEIGGAYTDPLLSAATNGARLGEERWAILVVDDWYPQPSPGSLVRTTGTVLVRLKVSGLYRR